MKKLIVALMIFLFLNLSINLVYASFLTSAITRLQPAAAVAGSAGSKIIPAIFTGTTAAGNVSSWISLTIPGGAVAKIAGAVVGVAGAMAIDYIFNNAPGWFVTKNIVRAGAGMVDISAVTYPTGKAAVDYTQNGDMGMYAAAAAAAAACQAAFDSRFPLSYLDQATQYGAQAGTDANYYMYGYYSHVTGGGSWAYYKFYYPKTGIAQGAPVVSNNPVLPGQVQSLLTTDLAANNANAVKVGQAAVEVAAAVMDNPNHVVNQSAAIKAAMAAALLEGVTAQQKIDLEGQAVPVPGMPVPVVTPDPAAYLTPAQVAAAVQAALAGQGLSAAQIAAAIAAATAGVGSGGLSAEATQAAVQSGVAAALAGQGMTPAQAAATAAAAAAQLAATQAATTAAEAAAAAQLEKMPPPPPPIPPDPVVTDPTIVMPDKKSLTTVMGTFMAAINSLPMMETLRGLTINVEGSSQLCLDMPVGLGGQKCFDGGRMQGGLNMIGSALLGLTTIFSFLGIFKG